MHGARLMQGIHRLAADPAHGHDGAGELCLGEAYERAYARLLRDLAAEDALHVDLGDGTSPTG